jgi:hypothetical protein
LYTAFILPEHVDLERTLAAFQPRIMAARVNESFSAHTLTLRIFNYNAGLQAFRLRDYKPSSGEAIPPVM